MHLKDTHRQPRVNKRHAIKKESACFLCTICGASWPTYKQALGHERSHGNPEILSAINAKTPPRKRRPGKPHHGTLWCTLASLARAVFQEAFQRAAHERIDVSYGVQEGVFYRDSTESGLVCDALLCANQLSGLFVLRASDTD